MSISSRRGARRPTLIILVSVAATLGCALPPSEPLDTGVLLANLERRDDDPRVALTALDRLGWVPVFARPDTRPAPRGSIEWWRERSVAFHPDVRLARRDLEATMALARGASAPEPIELNLEVANLQAGTENDLMATFDLLGLLGLGRSAKAALLAKAEVRAKHAILEEVTWRAIRAVARTLGETEAATERELGLARLLEELRPLMSRARAAASRGWLSKGAMARAEALINEIEGERAMASVDLARRRATLATEAGLPPGETDVFPIARTALTRTDQTAVVPDIPSTIELLGRMPLLRRLSLEYAVADANVAAVAAENFPNLAIGPRLIIDPMSTLGGLVAESSLPWPTSVDSQVDAAIARRAQAREALEDAVLRAAHNLKARHHATRILHDQVHVNLRARRESVDAWWSAATGAFEADLMRFEDALMVAEARMRFITTQALLQLELANAHDELQEALGPSQMTVDRQERISP